MAEFLRSHTIGIRMLASGSSGNSILLSTEKVNLLVDAGLSCRELVRRLARAGLAPGDISAVIVTHEHQDHARGLGVLSRQYRIPVYMNVSTMESTCAYVGKVPTARTFSTGDALSLGDLTVRTYSVPHDAADPVGLSVNNSSSCIGIALDMGYPTKLVKQRLRESNVLILEFNHDPEMLRQCPRPWELKQRILSKKGHMSNHAAVELLCELVHDGLRAVVLAHISREANSAEHVYSLVSERLKEIGRSDIAIFVGSQDEVGNPIKV
ncbi:MAG: MBL fold metallo-hydrolase [Candidatus Hydrogenedentota bacterium]|nr:MAG: MBL fold metallo-hydrolase [Candidatus Hydrogenedentota bacterium]